MGFDDLQARNVSYEHRHCPSSMHALAKALASAGGKYSEEGIHSRKGLINQTHTFTSIAA